MNNITTSGQFPVKALPIISDEEAKAIFNKGWSFFNIYSLRELRDIYLLYKGNPNLNIPQFSIIVNEKIEPEEKEWSERRVLENINALKNVRLISLDGEVLENVFGESEINKPLSDSDKETFDKIFFSYFRFKEIASWFISPDNDFHKQYELLSKQDIIEKSNPIYYYCRDIRFTNTFFYEIENDNQSLYIIEDKMSHLMRFWDVFIKWGLTLGVIEKISLNALQGHVSVKKDVSMAYFIKGKLIDFDLYSYVKTYYKERSIFLPELIFKIAKESRCSIIELKQFIISKITEDERFTFERTSEIFIIKGKQSPKKIQEATYLYPKHNDNYISHLIVRK